MAYMNEFFLDFLKKYRGFARSDYNNVLNYRDGFSDRLQELASQIDCTGKIPF